MSDRKRLFGTARDFDVGSIARGTNETFSYASSASSIPIKECQHETRAMCYVSYTDKDPGRRFWKCPYRRFDDCDFMEWVDPETPKYLQKLLVKLMDNKEKLEGELTLSKQNERDLVNKAEAGAAIARASRDIVSTMSIQIKEAEKTAVDLQRTKVELVEMNTFLDKKVDNLNEVKVKLVREKKKLKGKVKKLRMTCWFFAIMLAVFMIITARMAF